MNLKPLGANRTEIDLGDGRKVLFSYKTPVAYTQLTPEGREYYETETKWSRTTSKHIGQWMPREDSIKKPQEWFDTLIEVVQRESVTCRENHNEVR